MFIFSSNQACLENKRALSYSSLKDLSNNVLHALIKDHLTLFLKRFVVGSQIKILTFALSFAHNHAYHV
jgi:hypothetical protein